MLDILDAVIKAVCPIDGLSQTEHSIRIDFKVSATPSERAAARALRDDWLTKTEAEKQAIADQQEAINNAEKADFKANITADIQTIDDYFAIAAPTNAQHFAQLRAISRITRRLLRIVKRELT